MQIVDSALQLAASDLSRFLSCQHCTALDMEVAQGIRAKPHYYDSFVKMLVERGLAHEKEYVESIEAGGDEVINLDGLSRSEAAERCLEAMRKGQPAIVQGVLRGGEWLRLADLLRRGGTPHPLGSLVHEGLE